MSTGIIGKPQDRIDGKLKVTGRAMYGAGFGLRAKQVHGAELHARGAQRHCGRYAGCIGDSTGGDHGHADRFDDLRQQRKGADLSGQILR